MYLFRETCPELDDNSEAKAIGGITKSGKLNWGMERARCTWCESDRKLHLGL